MKLENTSIALSLLEPAMNETNALLSDPVSISIKQEKARHFVYCLLLIHKPEAKQHKSKQTKFPRIENGG